MSALRCKGCRKALRGGDAMYGGDYPNHWHWSCFEAAHPEGGSNWEEASLRFDAALKKLRAALLEVEARQAPPILPPQRRRR